MQYFMLVIVFPFTYLVVNISANGFQNVPGFYFIGFFTSLIMSLFVNMQAQLVSTSRNVTTIEMYRCLNVEPIYVYIGQCIVHALYAVPAFVLMIILIGVRSYSISVLSLMASIILSLWFRSFFAIFVGSLIKNPNLASPMVSLLYMLFVMITPLYTNLANLNSTIKMVYLFNPFTHIHVLLSEACGVNTGSNIYISIVVLSILSILLTIFSFKHCSSFTAEERLNVF